FAIEDVTERVLEMAPEVEEEMSFAKEYLAAEKEPAGPCDCLYRGRSSHCTTASYSLSHLPPYGVHDLTRIGISKRKLTELVDGNKFLLSEVPGELELS